MKYTIRRVDVRSNVRYPKDLKAIYRLNNLEFDDSLVSDVMSGWWWVVVHKGTIIAFAGLVLSRNYFNSTYLIRCIVDQSYRNQGLQKRLIAVRERHARAMNIVMMVTDTSVDNHGSSNALIACGYRLFAGVNYATYENPLYWRKYL